MQDFLTLIRRTSAWFVDSLRPGRILYNIAIIEITRRTILVFAPNTSILTSTVVGVLVALASIAIYRRFVPSGDATNA